MTSKISFFLLSSLLLALILLNLGLGLSSFEDTQLILELRFLRTLTAIFAGAGLGVCGLVLQTWFRNSLADPFLLGVNSGANLFIALGVFGASLFGVDFSNFSLIFLGVFGGVLTLLLLLSLNKFFNSSVYLIIFGLLFSYLTNGIINIFTVYGSEYDLKNYLIFTFGSFEKVLGFDIFIFLFCVLSLSFLIFRIASHFNYYYLGEDYASSLGVDLKKFQKYLVLLIGATSGLVGVYCGPIIFVGMMAPHFVRFLCKESDHKTLIPLTFLAGGFLSLLSDVIASHVFNSSLPINVVIGLIGTPIVGFVLFRSSLKGVTNA